VTTASKTKYVDVTRSSAKQTAPTSGAVVSSGVLSGPLTPTFSVADVPVRGPGLWTLSASSLIQAQLQCPARSVSVERRVVIMTAQNCQLQLTSTNPEVSPTWQLTPIT
jgi:hypothetical protein